MLRSQVVLVVVLLSCWSRSVAADHWAVLVAGSNGYENYRHQADVCHAYHIAVDNGIPKDHVITMVYGDIANDTQNPFPGQVFNVPTPAGVAGKDVWANCKMDYTGEDVTAANFLKVLTGDSSARGPVLNSSADDHVFVNFVDHGATGLVAFPTGPYLTVTELNAALKTMHDKKMYQKLVLYVEACESGSMFEAALPQDIEVYVTTASNAQESSWGVFCPPDDMVNGVSLGTCLGDLYSVNWMMDTEKNGMKETLDQQFQTVRKLTNMSHVMQYGDLTWTNLSIGEFEGGYDNMSHAIKQKPQYLGTSDTLMSGLVDARSIPLHLAMTRYLRAKAGNADAAVKEEALGEFQRILNAQLDTDNFFQDLVSKVATRWMNQEELLTQQLTLDCNGCCIDSLEAYRIMCQGFTDYGFQYARVFLNLCMALNEDSKQTIIQALESMCLGDVLVRFMVTF